MTIHYGWQLLPGWPLTPDTVECDSCGAQTSVDKAAEKRWHVGSRTFIDAYGETSTGVKHLCEKCTKAGHTPHGITQWRRIETWALEGKQ